MVADQRMDIAEATGEEVIVEDGDMQAPHMGGESNENLYQGMDEDDQAIMM